MAVNHRSGGYQHTPAPRITAAGQADQARHDQRRGNKNPLAHNRNANHARDTINRS